jgi:hypothetical protein
MKWIIDNWSLLVVLACAVIAIFIYVKKFVNMPTEAQIAKVKEWLLYAVLQAESEFGGGTGQLKLRYVYDLFLSRFPDIAKVISFEMFSTLVDEVLEQMRHLLETNLDINYVLGIGGQQ